MPKRERILAALQKEEVDRLPWSPLIGLWIIPFQQLIIMPKSSMAMIKYLLPICVGS